MERGNPLSDKDNSDLVVPPIVAEAASIGLKYAFGRYILGPILFGIVILVALIFGENAGAAALGVLITVVLLWLVYAFRLFILAAGITYLGYRLLGGWGGLIFFLGSLVLIVHVHDNWDRWMENEKVEVKEGGENSYSLLDPSVEAMLQKKLYECAAIKAASIEVDAAERKMEAALAGTAEHTAAVNELINAYQKLAAAGSTNPTIVEAANHLADALTQRETAP
jgi:hypothetical protein